MFLIEKRSGDLVRVDNVDALFNPFATEVMGRDQVGEEEQDWAVYKKADLTFPSGEALPKCWVDPEYRMELSRSKSS